MNSVYLVLLCYAFFIGMSAVTTLIVLRNKKNVLNQISEISKNQFKNKE